MSILSWNCRCLGGVSTIPNLRRYIRSTGADLVFILETKCNKEAAIRRIAQLPLPNSKIVPARGQGGGLWMLWANEISVEILESNLFFIAARINLRPRAQPWLLFAVYGDCSDAANSFIWGNSLNTSVSPTFRYALWGISTALLVNRKRLVGIMCLRRKTRDLGHFYNNRGWSIWGIAPLLLPGQTIKVAKHLF